MTKRSISQAWSSLAVDRSRLTFCPVTIEGSGEDVPHSAEPAGCQCQDCTLDRLG